MTAKRVLIGMGVILASIVVYGLVTSPRPTRSEKDRAAVERAADRLTHEEIAGAWTQSKLGNTWPMERIQKRFPLPPLSVREEGTSIVLTFAGHNGTCIHFRTGPTGSIVFARPC